MQLQLMQKLDTTNTGSVLALLQSLLQIIDRIKSHSGNWRATAAFVDYFHTSQEISVHPLKDILNCLQVLMFIVLPIIFINIRLSAQKHATSIGSEPLFQDCLSTIKNILHQFSSIGMFY